MVSTGDTKCIGTLEAITVGTVVGPDGYTCLLSGTRVKGNVFAYTDVTFMANRVRVTSNIQTGGAAAVDVNPGSVVRHRALAM